VRVANPRLSAQSAAIVRCCLMKDKEQRYRTALDLHADLAAARAEQPLPSRREVEGPCAAPAPPPARLPRWADWRTWTRRELAIAAGAAALLVVALIASAVPARPLRSAADAASGPPAAAAVAGDAAAPAQPALGREERLARARAQSESASPGLALKRSLRGTYVNIALDTVENLDARCMKVLGEIGLTLEKRTLDRLAGAIDGRLVDGTALHVTFHRINDDASEVTIQIGALGDKVRSAALFSDITR
jgi:hypothetical protein